MPQPPVFHPDRHWANFHQTYAQVQQGTWDLYYPRLNGWVANLQETTAQMQGVIAQAKAAGIPLRAVGSRWSLSSAPATAGWTVNTNRLRGRKKVRADELDAAYPGTADQKTGIYLFQCGNTVADVNKVIESPAEQRALFTSGAANGQTIVGATSTGTHGSALRFGAMHDHIVGIHLVPTADRHYWIERQSRPVMSKAFVASIGATLRRDDDLFNAAVMACGAFGFIESIAIETVPRYRLRTRPGRAPLDEDLWRAIGSLDFSAHSFFGGQGEPYFFQAIINPASDEVLLNANYKESCPAQYQPEYGLTQEPNAIGPGFDSLSAVGLILDHFNGLIPLLSQVAAAGLFNTTATVGTPGEIYGFKAPQLHVASGSIAVRLQDARRTLEALIQLYRQIGPVPLVLGCRYVRKSPALLAFNKFDTGLMISIDGVDSTISRAYFAAAAALMESMGIDHTQHWGKTNAYNPQRVAKAYGPRLQTWSDCRRKVLPAAADRQLFDNDYTRRCGIV